MQRQRSWCAAVLMIAALIGCGGAPGGKTPEELARMGVPNFTVTSLDGETITLSDHLNGGAILLDFSATWCGPCSRAVPGVKRLHQAWGDTLTIIAIFDARSAGNIRDYVKTHDIRYPVAIDADGAVARAWQVEAFPTFVVIGRDGKAKYYGHEIAVAGGVIEGELRR